MGHSCYILLFALLELSSGGQLRNDLYGKHLRVSVGHLPPSSVFVRNSTGHIVGYSGSIFEIFDWLSKRLHFTYSMYPVSVNVVGRHLGNGTWTGALGELVRKEYDISLGPFAPTHERFGAIDFVIYSGGSSSWLVIKYPESRLSDSAVFEPFSPMLWLLWFCSMVFVGIIAFLLVYLRDGYVNLVRNRYSQIDAMFMYLLGTMTAQGGYYRTGSQSIRFVAAIWCFTAFCFIYIYSCILTSRLSAHYQYPEINSLEDLAKHKNYQLVSLKGSIWDLEIMTSKTGALGIVGERYRRCGDSCSLPTIAEVMKKPLQGNYVAYLAHAFAAGILDKDFKETGKCRMTFGSVDYGWAYSFMGVARGSPYTEEFHRESLWAKAFGFNAQNENWPDRGYSLPRQCVLKYNSKGVSVQQFNLPIKLIQIYPAFILLIAGHCIGLLLFAFEKLYARFKVPDSSTGH